MQKNDLFSFLHSPWRIHFSLAPVGTVAQATVLLGLCVSVSVVSSLR